VTEIGLTDRFNGARFDDCWFGDLAFFVFKAARTLIAHIHPPGITHAAGLTCVVSEVVPEVVKAGGSEKIRYA
jgi:hypothetical protein